MHQTRSVTQAWLFDMYQSQVCAEGGIPEPGVQALMHLHDLRRRRFSPDSGYHTFGTEPQITLHDGSAAWHQRPEIAPMHAMGLSAGG